ncbi:hypothetical protein Hamer_G002152, partial [Homarus americanus]
GRGGGERKVLEGARVWERRGGGPAVALTVPEFSVVAAARRTGTLRAWDGWIDGVFQPLSIIEPSVWIVTAAETRARCRDDQKKKTGVTFLEDRS